MSIDRWDRMYMDMTVRASEESQCAAKKVGCLLVWDNTILAVGINGTFPHTENCNSLFKKMDGVWFKNVASKFDRMHDINTKWEACSDQEEHHKWSLIHEVHAEMNAIANAHKNGVSLENATAYVTHSPCFNCAKELFVHGIERIVFINSYDDIEDIKELLKDHNVELIDYNTGNDVLLEGEE
jgi:dCMP deaminase